MSELRSRAWLVVACFVATLAFGLVLLLAFDSDIQQIDAAELVDRAGDARAFLIADLFFPLFYGLLTAVAQLRFGAALSRVEGAGDGRPPGWIVASAVLLVGAGIFDLAENVLLLTATGSESQGAVDVAHAVAIPNRPRSGYPEAGAVRCRRSAGPHRARSGDRSSAGRRRSPALAGIEPGHLPAPRGPSEKRPTPAARPLRGLRLAPRRPPAERPRHRERSKPELCGCQSPRDYLGHGPARG